MIEAMKQALEALEFVEREIKDDWINLHIKESITSLRQAIAEAEKQEPVGYWMGEFSKDGGATLYEVPQESAFGRKYRNIPLYTSPPQRQPLTDEERFQLRCQWNPEIHGLLHDYLIQQTEAAHGIKGEV